MKINKDELKTVLETVKPALAGKEFIEQTTSFAFINGKVVTYNDEVSISCPLVGLDFEGAVKAEEVYKLLTKTKAEEVTLEVVENELVIKAGRARAGMALQNKILLPLDEEILLNGEWKPLPNDFLKACKFAALSASADMANPILTCVHIDEKGVVEGTNNYRIAHWNLGKKLPIQSTLIPAQSILKVIKIEPNEILSSENGWVHFKNESGVIISCRVFNEKYVNTTQYIKEGKEGTEIEFPEETNEILGRAGVFVEKQSVEDEKVDVYCKKEKLYIYTKSENSWFKESTVLKGAEDFSFSITPYLLMDILKNNNKCILSDNVLRFSGENWIYISTLIK